MSGRPAAALEERMCESVVFEGMVKEEEEGCRCVKV